jgi:hypothetical protein
MEVWMALQYSSGPKLGAVHGEVTKESVRQFLSALSSNSNDLFDLIVRRLSMSDIYGNAEYTKYVNRFCANSEKIESFYINKIFSDLEYYPYQIDIEPRDLSLVVLDDLLPDAIVRVAKEGFEPSAIVETSSKNYQIWVRVAREPITEDEHWAIAQWLQNRYHSDPGAVARRHAGKLPGFPNFKPKHRRDDTFPIARLVYAKYWVASNGWYALEEGAKAYLDEERKRRRL